MTAISTAPPAVVWSLLVDARTRPVWSAVDSLVVERSSGLTVGTVRAFRTGRTVAGERLTGLVEEEQLTYEHAFNPRVRAAVAFMRERLAEPITLGDLAGEVHLSVYHFVRVFRDATGQTPHRLLTGLRIDEAKRLLRGTDLPIARIASRCGFADSGALSAAFLRHTAMRPSVYRNS